MERPRPAPTLITLLLIALTIVAAGTGFAIAAVCVGWPRAPHDATEYGLMSDYYTDQAVFLAAGWFARASLLQTFISGTWLFLCWRRRMSRPVGLGRATLLPAVSAALLCVGAVSCATWRSDPLVLFRRDVMDPIPPSVSIRAAYGWKGPDGERRGFIVRLSPQDFDRLIAADAFKRVTPSSPEFTQTFMYKKWAEEALCSKGQWPPELVELWTGVRDNHSVFLWTNGSHDTAYIVADRGNANEI